MVNVKTNLTQIVYQNTNSTTMSIELFPSDKIATTQAPTGDIKVGQFNVNYYPPFEWPKRGDSVDPSLTPLLFKNRVDRIIKTIRHMFENGCVAVTLCEIRDTTDLYAELAGHTWTSIDGKEYRTNIEVFDTTHDPKAMKMGIVYNTNNLLLTNTWKSYYAPESQIPHSGKFGNGFGRLLAGCRFLPVVECDDGSRRVCVIETHAFHVAVTHWGLSLEEKEMEASMMPTMLKENTNGERFVALGDFNTFGDGNGRQLVASVVNNHITSIECPTKDSCFVVLGTDVEVKSTFCAQTPDLFFEGAMKVAETDEVYALDHVFTHGFVSVGQPQTILGRFTIDVTQDIRSKTPRSLSHVPNFTVNGEPSDHFPVIVTLQ